LIAYTWCGTYCMGFTTTSSSLSLSFCSST